MIEQELRDKLKTVQANIVKATRMQQKAIKEKDKKELREKLVYFDGYEQGLLVAIKLLWGEKEVSDESKF